MTWKYYTDQCRVFRSALCCTCTQFFLPLCSVIPSLPPLIFLIIIIIIIINQHTCNKSASLLPHTLAFSSPGVLEAECIWMYT